MKPKQLKRPTVLTFTRYFAPGYKAGGPVRTLDNLVEFLGSDVDFYIVTTDRDMGDLSPYSGVLPLEWTAYKNAYVYYMSPGMIDVSRLAEIIRSVKPDMIYLNSFFDERFTQRVLIGRRLKSFDDPETVVAPRGEFSKGALSIKYFKKRLYIAGARILGLYRGITWQATTEREAQEIRAAFSPARHQRIEVVGNLAMPKLSWLGNRKRDRGRVSQEELRVCFLSRVSPKKNLEFALRALAAVRCKVKFSIYGPVEVEAYFARCKRWVEYLPSNVEVEFVGPIPNDEVRCRLSQHDVFLFPTRGENYGHVIVEALASGLFTIISDQTPWGNLDQAGVGIALPLSDVTRYTEVVETCAQWPESKWSDVRKKAVSYAEEIGSDSDTLERNRKFFIESDWVTKANANM
jgi:glycosyltransferase involved in cell wall biosynthesis